MNLSQHNIIEQILKLVETYPIITIYRHVNADGDAYGSSFGLKYLLQELYPDKTICVLSDDQGALSHFYPTHDTLSDEMIQQSLAIVVDTANHQRISHCGWQQAKQIIKIDHHPRFDQYAPLEWVEEHVSSCCELIGLIAIHVENKLDLSLKTATIILSGILTDTINFSIPAVNAQTLKVASFLVSKGINLSQLNQDLFLETKAVYDYKTWLRNHYKIENGVVYGIVNQVDYEAFGIDFVQAKEHVNVYKPLLDAEVWCLCAFDPKTASYSCSVRSRKIRINDVVARFNGGGHQLASGVKNLSRQQVDELLLQLQQRLKEVI